MSGQDSSPEKRNWKKMSSQSTSKGKGKGPSKGKALVKGRTKFKSSPIKWVDADTYRNADEPSIEVIHRATSQGILLEPTSFYRMIIKFSPEVREECLADMYMQAKKANSSQWVKAIRGYARFDFPDEWIERNIPSVDGSKLPQRRRSSAGEAAAGHSRDFRLDKDPTLPVLRENAPVGVASDVSTPEPLSTPIDAEPRTSIESQSVETEEPMDVSEPVKEETPTEPASETVECPISERSATVDVPPAPKEPVPSVSGYKEKRQTISKSSKRRVEPPTKESSMRQPRDLRRSRNSPERPKSRDSYKHASSSRSRERSSESRKQRRVHDSPDEGSLTVTVNQPVSKQGARSLEREIQYCPISSCSSTDKRLRRHVVFRHLPEAFRYTCATEANIAIQVDALRWLVEAALGSDVRLQDAVSWMNRYGRIPGFAHLNNEHQDAYYEACRAMGERTPIKFTIHPVNSPAVLLFWRCMLALLMECSPEQVEQFPSFPEFDRLPEPEPSLPEAAVMEPAVDEAEESDLGDLIMLDEVGDSGDDEPGFVEPQMANLPGVFDSHFHLDRTSMKIWQTAVGHTVEDLLAYSSSREVDFKPSVKINLVGGVIVHSEPRTYPDINFSVQGPWKVAIGVHPKHCDTLTVERSLVLKQLLQHPKVVALGECGLDRTVPASRWSRQDEVFKRMLNLARADQPLILHLRGPQGDAYGVDVHARCLQLMRKICDRNQLIHVHCFKGTVEMVEDWLVEFPRSYFGVTAAVQSFDDSQIAGLRAVPRDKLLLETDSPYFPPGRALVNTPAYLGDVAAFVTAHLDLRPTELYQLTLNNAIALYGA
ncbi:hypothetical protein FSP39_014347 [Pinctada imbricata]|uniref:TatD n=1 Tax=Pinctada imbricata TaxID=66713 RepID=A0AA88Y3J3_PINIB|nr:hypothetical protein FSP39_014347 [Pinctada imbricata]